MRADKPIVRPVSSVGRYCTSEPTAGTPWSHEGWYIYGRRLTDGADARRGDAIPARGGDRFNEVLGPELLEVVGGVARPVRSGALSGHGLDLCDDVHHAEPLGCGCQGEPGREQDTRAGLVEIDPADPGVTHDRGGGQVLQGVIRDKGMIHRVQRGKEPLDHAAEACDDLRELGHDSTTAQGLRVVDNCLEAQDVLAFGIGLERERAKVQLEHRQVIHRSLEHNCKARGRGCLVPEGTALGPKYRLEVADRDAGARAVNQALKDLLHLATATEQQVAAVLDVIHRVCIAKAAALLLVRVEGDMCDP